MSKSEGNAPVQPISRLRLDGLEDFPFIVLVGARRSGKTHLTKWMFSQMQSQFDAVFILTRTGASGAWDDVEYNQMFRENFPEALQVIIECQEQVRTIHGKKRMPRVCVILDDILGHLGRNDVSICDLATQGRHLHVTVFLLSQHYTAFAPEVRNNTDLLIVFSNMSQSTGESIFEETSYSADISKQDFRSMYRDIAQGYTALAILRTSKHMATDERFFHVEAPEKIKLKRKRKKRDREQTTECIIL